MSENEGKSTALVTLRQDLEKAMPKLQEVASSHLKVERVVRILLSAASRNPKLLECSRESVLTFCMKCSETGLEPIGAGGAWPVPYKNKNGTVEMQFIPDYRGLVNCAKRAGCITDAYAEIVRAQDEFDYSLGLDPTLTHKPARGERGEVQSAYCVFKLADGTRRFVVMDKEELDSIKKRSKARDFGPWVTDENEMYKKTVIRRAMKPFAGMSPELDAAIDADNATVGVELREPIRPTTEKKPKTIDAETPPPVAPSPDNKDDLVAEIKAWSEKAKAKDIKRIADAAGWKWDEDEPIEMLPIGKLVTLRSLIRA